MKKKEFDFESIRKMSKEQKIQSLQKMSKTANSRLKTLESKGLTKNAYAKTQRLLSYQNKTRFYEGKNYKNNYEIERALSQLEYFLTSKSSTVRGYKQLKKDRIQAFADKGIFIKNENVDDFYNFLSSQQFKELGKRVDSNQVIEDFAEYLKNFSVEEILQEFDAFLQDTKYTFEQVGERLNATKGKLLH